MVASLEPYRRTEVCGNRIQYRQAIAEYEHASAPLQSTLLASLREGKAGIVGSAASSAKTASGVP